MSKEWNVAIAAGLGTLLAACQRQAIPPFVATNTSTPTSRPPSTATLERTTPTPDNILLHDLEIIRLLESTSPGVSLKFFNVLISQIEHYRGGFFVARLSAKINGGISSVVANITSASCIFEALQSENALGQQTNNSTWRPNKRLDVLEGEITRPLYPYFSWPTIEAEKVVLNGKTFACGGSTQITTP